MSVRRRLNRIRLDKIAAVDAPCQQHATAGIVKRAPDQKAIAKVTFDEALEAQMVSRRVNEAFYRVFDSQWERNDAFRTALTDELAGDGDGSAAKEAYLASIEALVEDAITAARKAGAKATDESIEKAIEEVLVAKFSPEETTMLKIATIAALTDAIAKFDPAKSPVADVATIQKAATDLGAEDQLPAEGPLAKAKADPQIAKLTRELAIVKLSPDARSYFDGLDEAGQDAFLAKSDTDRAADIEKATGDDPVVYTTKGGIAVRKSDGPTALALAKQADATSTELAKLRGETETVSIEKRVSDFPNVAKDVATQMVKSARELGEDTDAGKGIIKSLTTMNDAADPLFKRHGSTGSETTVPAGMQKARETFAGKVSEIAKRDNIGRAAAMEKAETEHSDLFAEAYPETEAAEAETVEA